MDLVVSMSKFPESGETVNALDFSTIPGGKGLNQAVAAARAGAHVQMFGALGTDDNSKALEKILENEGVSRVGIQKYEGSSGVAIVEVERSSANRIAIVPGANGKFTYNENIQAVFNELSGSFVLGPLENPIAEIEKYFVAAKKAGITTILNPAPVQMLSPSFLNTVDILIPNQHEAQELTGIEIKDESDAEMAGRQLLNNGHKIVIITLGEKGAILVSPHEVIFQKAFRVESIDTTAAGDTFCGTFAAELDRGSNSVLALEMASAAAALSTTILGASTSIPDRRKVLEFIQN